MFRNKIDYCIPGITLHTDVVIVFYSYTFNA